jgi:hypothetical protein
MGFILRLKSFNWQKGEHPSRFEQAGWVERGFNPTGQKMCGETHLTSG